MKVPGTALCCATLQATSGSGLAFPLSLSPSRVSPSPAVSLSLPAHCAHVGLRARHTHTHTTQTHTLCTRVGTPSSFGSPCGTFSVFLQPSLELFNTDGLCCFSHGRGGSRTRSFNVISNSSGQCWRGCVMCVKGWKKLLCTEVKMSFRGFGEQWDSFENARPQFWCPPNVVLLSC